MSRSLADFTGSALYLDTMVFYVFLRGTHSAAQELFARIESSAPNLSLLDVASADLDVMDEAMRRYHLRPRDALHLAAMRKCACRDLASNDSDFDQVPDVRRYTL